MILKWRKHQNCGDGSKFQGRLVCHIDFVHSGCVCVCCRFGEPRSHAAFAFDIDVFFFCACVVSLQLIIKLEATPN